ncbi:MAG: carbonic anhydrase, partial [Flavobacterium sp.]|nr:carbonic anhydrase [Flavobacterium sp.]
LVSAVAQHNVIHTMDEILDRSDVLRELFESGQIGIAGAYYDIETGEVQFMKEVLHD